MSLDVNKLEKVRELAGGLVQARCPACAEGGHDRTGEHLRIYPDGRFGCCVHAKDGAHRKRIFALAGVRKAGTFTLRIKTPPAMASVRSVRTALTAFDGGTLGTPVLKSVSIELKASQVFQASHDLSIGSGALAKPNSGTLGTAKVKSCAYARGDTPTANIDKGYFLEQLKDSESVVPSVPSLEVVLPPITAGQRLPFLTAGGTLSIPFDSLERYHWWKLDGERLTVAETLQEVKERNIHAVTV